MKTTTPNFKEKVQAMTAKEIIMVFVDSLLNPVIAVDMATFGMVENGFCYGCAATNTVCKIAGEVFNARSICDAQTRADFIKSDIEFLYYFELAINSLRKGNLSDYNYYADKISIADINDTVIPLPFINNDYTQEDLQAYIILANAQN